MERGAIGSLFLCQQKQPVLYNKAATSTFHLSKTFKKCAI